MTEQCEWVFPPPYVPSEKYRARILSKPEGEQEGWPRTRVSVERDDGHEQWTVIYVYDRNYSMLKTFLPFRQLHDSVWRDYAFISPRYASFSVLDLQTGEIAAERSPGEEELKRITKVRETYLSGKNKDAEGKYAQWWRDTDPVEMSRADGFCPVEFWVPDFTEEWDERNEPREKNRRPLEETLAELVEDRAVPDMIPGEKVTKENVKWWGPEEERMRGNWALYSGCHWGDDSSWKVQYIDLSRLHEGIVTTDDRFGYVQLPAESDLKDAVRYNQEIDHVEISVPVQFNRQTGVARKYAIEGINTGAK